MTHRQPILNFGSSAPAGYGSYATDGDPSTRGNAGRNDDTRIPDGYASLIGKMHTPVLKAQRGGKLFNPAKRFVTNEVFDIHAKDIVFSIDIQPKHTVDTGVGAGYFYGGTEDSGGDAGLVTSTLNGIEQIFQIPENIKSDEGLLELYVLSNIRPLGQAFSRMYFDRNGETSTRGFAVQYAGVVTVEAHRSGKIGEYVRYAIPSRNEYNSQTWAMRKGVDQAKVGLILCPVRECDGAYFGLQCCALLRRMEQSISGFNNVNVGHVNLTAFGRCLETFALTCGLGMVYRLMQFGFLQVEDPYIAQNDQAVLSLRQFLDKPGAVLGDVDARERVNQGIKKLSSLPTSARSRIGGPGENGRGVIGNTEVPGGTLDGRTRGSTVFYTTSRGSIENWARDVNLNVGANPAREAVQNAEIRAHTTPEQVVGILSVLFGLVDQKVGERDLGREMAAAGDFNIRNAIASKTVGQEQMAKQCKSAFLETIFSKEADVAPGGASDPAYSDSRVIRPSELEIGYTTDDSRHLVRRRVGGSTRDGVQWIPANNVYSQLDSSFKNSLPMLFQSLSNVTNLHKSLIAGKIIKGSEPGGVYDVVFNN